MSVLRKLKNQWSSTQTFTTLTDRTPYFTDGGLRLNVGRDRALRIATVWACVKVRAEEIGGLPVDVIERAGSSRIQKELPAWLDKPNPETTRFELFERTSASIDTDGNAFWYYERDRIGRVAEVWCLPPAATEVYRDPPKAKGEPPGPKRFRVSGEEYGPENIVHIPGFGLPGRLRGMSPLDQHIHSMSLAAAAEEYGEAFFGNGAIMSGVIEHPSDPGADGARRMQQSFAADHVGLGHAHKPGVLFGGAKWTPLTIPNEQAQFLETRGYQRIEICGVYRVPPHKVQILDRATFSNIEHQAIDWVTSGLMPTTSRIEAAVLAAGLLDQGDHLRFKFQGLLRGDTVTRFASYAIARQWGWMSADDIREHEDENPLPDGQGSTYLLPLNMVAAGNQTAETYAKINGAGALVRAGYDPVGALSIVGLDPIEHLGVLPVTVQPTDDDLAIVAPAAAPSNSVEAVLAAAGVDPTILKPAPQEAPT